MTEKDLFLPNGYIDMKGVLEKCGTPFILMLGGRGTGKTYGATQIIHDTGKGNLWLRRLQTQCDLITTQEFSPFKSINNECGYDINLFKFSKYNSMIADTDVNENGKIIPAKDSCYGYTAALSTFANVRGADFSGTERIFYDEFVPEKRENPIVDEGDALLNLYETINRNRELKGFSPVTMVCMSNSTDAANPIFRKLLIVDEAMTMREKGIQLKINKKRGYTLIVFKETKIGSQKRDTALYRLAQGTGFAESAIENKFSNNKPTNLASRNIAEYTPFVRVGELTLYKHKSKKLFYCTTFKSGSPPFYEGEGKGLSAFQLLYAGMLYKAAVMGMIEYESYNNEVLLDTYVGIKNR